MIREKGAARLGNWPGGVLFAPGGAGGRIHKGVMDS